MTRVYCSKKLHDFIGNVEDELPVDVHDIKLSDWNAHLFYLEKRKCIVFVNIMTYYVVFITDIVKKDLKNIDEIFMSRLREQLMHDKVINNNSNLVQLTDGEKIRFVKTNNNKKVIGRINDFVYTFKVHCVLKYGHLSEMDIVHENGLINTISTGKYSDIRKTWASPLANLKELIQNSTNSGLL